MRRWITWRRTRNGYDTCGADQEVPPETQNARDRRDRGSAGKAAGLPKALGAAVTLRRHKTRGFLLETGVNKGQPQCWPFRSITQAERHGLIRWSFFSIRTCREAWPLTISR